MSSVDVTDLQRENLPSATFPADMRSAFRLHLAPEVHHGVEAHAKADPSVEICGVLVGQWGQDAQGPFALVTDYIRCDNAASKLAEVTFTHESWSQINHEMDTRYADKRIVGWYHSHPDFGIFLSDRDCFIHEHFFSGAGQVAYVVDPVRDLEGVFSWQKGKPTPMSHFWVGSQIHTVQASQRNAARESSGAVAYGGEQRPQDASTDHEAPRYADRSPLPTATTLLAWLSLFLLGYLAAGARSRWEQEKIIEGTVAHYGYSKVMKLGLEQDLAKVRKNLTSIGAELDKLPKATAKLAEDEASTAEKKRQVISDSLLLTERALGQIQEKYALTADELSTLSQLVAQKHADLRTPPPSPTAGAAELKKAGAAPAQPAPSAPVEKAPATTVESMPTPKDSSK
jgi:proteasome lid subunit RPN8/RPN11